MTAGLRRQLPCLLLALLLILIEVGIWACGLWTGSPARIRAAAVTWIGFWPGILDDWQANFRLQPVTMFGTYWLIHAGPAHLIGNLAIMGWFSWRIGPYLRPAETLEIWLASVLGGAVVFGFLSQSISPMIGASGGVFGLLGAVVVIDNAMRRCDFGVRSARLRTVFICVGLFALSLVDFTLRNAVLAWQAHLGGFLIGVALTAALVSDRDWRA